MKLFFFLLTVDFFILSSNGQIVNGVWSPWQVQPSDCTAKCGGGTKERSRSCSNPAPSGGGAPCIKNDGSSGDFETEKIPCNEHPCYVESEENWKNWTHCENCTIGISYRENLCGDEVCKDNQYKNETKECNRWSLGCPDQCPKREEDCPQYSNCVDISTEEEPLTICKCTMGYKLSKDGKNCYKPPPPLPTPRPTPTLPPEQKKVATVLSKSASVILIVFVSITLALFLFMRIFTTDRVIQMNMEIALLMAHIFLMFPSETVDNPGLCKFVSMAIHFFFTAVYIFITLDAINMYGFVAQVVKKGGYFTKVQNILIGWGLSALIVLMCICFQFDNYGASYHCWLQVDTPLVYGHIIPAIVFSIITFTLIEAAGMTDDYQPLPGINPDDLLSAKISQRTNLIILPLVIAHWIIGIYSEYEQNLPLYGVFSVLNGVLGFCVFFFHCTNNSRVRNFVYGCFKNGCGRK